MKDVDRLQSRHATTVSIRSSSLTASFGAGCINMTRRQRAAELAECSSLIVGTNLGAKQLGISLGHVL